MEKSSIDIWIGVNKNGTISMFTEIPSRGNENWVGKYYINSIIEKYVQNIVSNSSMNWSSEPEFLQLSLQKK